MPAKKSESQTLRDKHKGMSKARAAATVAASKVAPVREINRIRDQKKSSKKKKKEK